MIKKTVTWILVADGTQARLYGNDGPGQGIYHATERDSKIDLPAKAGNIMSDREGRAANPSGPGHHVMSARTDPRQHLEAEFLRKVTTELDIAAEAKFYDQLVLVAPPKALGMLRMTLGQHAAALVTKELKKDLVNLSERELERYFLKAEAIV